jgi:hypothetical protein
VITYNDDTLVSAQSYLGAAVKRAIDNGWLNPISGQFAEPMEYLTIHLRERDGQLNTCWEVFTNRGMFILGSTDEIIFDPTFIKAIWGDGSIYHPAHNYQRHSLLHLEVGKKEYDDIYTPDWKWRMFELLQITDHIKRLRYIYDEVRRLGAVRDVNLTVREAKEAVRLENIDYYRQMAALRRVILKETNRRRALRRIGKVRNYEVKERWAAKQLGVGLVEFRHLKRDAYQRMREAEADGDFTEIKRALTAAQKFDKLMTIAREKA